MRARRHLSPRTDDKTPRLSLSEQVAEQIAQAIIGGDLSPGQWITEEELSRRYGVSRSPVREALRALAAEGVVNLVPRRGASVARYDASQISDLYESRALLEPTCFRLAVPRLKGETVHVLEGYFRQMVNAVGRDEPEAYLAATVRFHETVHAACPNAVLRDMIRLLWRRILLFRHIIVHVPGRLPQSLALHRKIYEAVKRRDNNDAAEAVRDLIQDSHLVLLNSLHPALSLVGDGKERER